MSNVALELTNVRKKIKNKEIIKDVNLTVRQGEVYGFIGPNGAGKTTTIRMIVGLMDMTEGEIKVLGKSIEKEYKDAARNLGAIVENPEMYPFMTGRQNLRHFARMYEDVPKGRVEEVVSLVGLDQAIDEKVSKYSLGMRQRLGIAQAILHKPAVLILDEPTNGLDPAGIREIRDYIRRLAVEDNVAVMISSHLLSEIELMCDRIGIIKHGELITEQSVKEVSEETEETEIKVILDVKEIEAAIDVLSSLELQGEKEGSQLVSLMPRESIPQVVNKLVEAGLTVYGITGVKPSLEDQFLELTGGISLSNFFSLLYNELFKIYIRKSTWVMYIILGLIAIGGAIIMSSIDDVQPTNYTDNWQEELQEENETLQKDNEEFGYSFNDEQIMKNEYLLENDIRPLNYGAWQYTLENVGLVAIVSLLTIIIGSTLYQTNTNGEQLNYC